MSVYEFSIPDLAPGHDLNLSLTRELFNQKIMEPIMEERVKLPIGRALMQSDCDDDEVKEILLTGGSSRIPYVK